MSKNSFKVGARWQVQARLDKSGCRSLPWVWVIVGPPEWSHNSARTHKQVRYEIAGHENGCPYGRRPVCLHGGTMDVPHNHLKKYATCEANK